MGNVGTE